jgi:hypothetical protein
MVRFCVLFEFAERQVHIILSNSATEYIEALYSSDAFAIIQVRAGRAISSTAKIRGKLTELLVVNHPVLLARCSSGGGDFSASTAFAVNFPLNRTTDTLQGHYALRDCYKDASFVAGGSPVICKWAGTTQCRIRAESAAMRPSPIMTLIETAMAMIRPITDWTQ